MLQVRNVEIVTPAGQSIKNVDVLKYNGKVSSGSGNAGLLHQGTEQANIVCNALEAGLSSSEATCFVNFHRERLEINLEPICRSAVQGFMKRSPFIKMTTIQAKKSGKDDPKCQWAIARLNQSLQVREQLYLGFIKDKNDPELLNSPFKPIYADGIAWWDEHHEKVILGSAGVYQHNISRDESGAVISPAEGGVFSEDKTTTSIEYPGEGRGSFGVTILTKGITAEDPEGIKEGIRIVPFNYTNRKVVTDKTYQLAIEIELRRVLPLKNQWKTAGYGYHERYGEL
jgi:hypothetical protein